jgi:hypothetical protein
VGTRYFFCSPLPLFRYLKIELPLRAGLQLKKYGSPLALVRSFGYCYFFCSPLLLVLNSAITYATAIFTEVHCILQFAIPQFAIPQFAILQFAIPQFAIPQFAIPQFAILQYAFPQFAILQFAIPQFAIPRFAIPQYHYQYRPPII